MRTSLYEQKFIICVAGNCKYKKDFSNESMLAEIHYFSPAEDLPEDIVSCLYYVMKSEERI